MVLLRTPKKKLTSKAPNPTYTLTLHKTYYNQGFFNLGVDISALIRATSGPATLLLGPNKTAFDVRVNREANANGTPRIMGGAHVRNWLQDNFDEKAEVTVEVISPETLWLH